MLFLMRGQCSQLKRKSCPFEFLRVSGPGLSGDAAWSSGLHSGDDSSPHRGSSCSVTYLEAGGIGSGLSNGFQWRLKYYLNRGLHVFCKELGPRMYQGGFFVQRGAGARTVSQNRRIEKQWAGPGRGEEHENVPASQKPS
jgi:hypothetical protein